ncbi:MAG: hypothetical protein HY084_03600 [Gemmatimonadetes bacterium]|nr:hypothetical protein [Gemmatimonadota bacterium]
MRAIAAFTVGWLALWALVAASLPRTPAIPDSALNNAIAAERLRSDALDGRTVLLGSSLIGQLPIARFVPGALNLGLSAHGAATGVRLVDRDAHLPAVAVVETNELLAPPDSAYVDSLRAGVSRRSLPLRAMRFEFRPSTQAIAALVRVSRLVRRLEPEAGKRAAERRVAERWASLPPDTAGARTVARWVATWLRTWQRQGVRVVLVELPQHQLVMESAARRAARRIVDEELPEREFPRLRLGDRAWRTSDARHLESDDALEAARALAAALARP